MASKKTTSNKPKPEEAASSPFETKTSVFRRLAVQAVFWLVFWSLLFGAWQAGRALIERGLPTIRIEWPDREKDATPLAKWVKKNRPGLEADYAVVGTELRRTAERLESGRLVGPIDAAADTIARVQPEVSDAAGWREFISALTGRFQGGDASALAGEYREAAGAFGVTAAVESLIDISGGSEDEESAVETMSEDGDAAGAVDAEGSDEVEDQPVAGGEDEIAAEKDRGNPGCPGGQCPTGTGYRYGGSYWGGTYPYYRLF